MNTFMWESRFTQQHLDVLQSMDIINIPPVVKRLACGEDGMGAMASTDDIDHTVQSAVQKIDFSRLDRR
jgi:phosphopantothenoylcysteine decarboxylase